MKSRSGDTSCLADIYPPSIITVCTIYGESMLNGNGESDIITKT